jgi:hypothetical protein
MGGEELKVRVKPATRLVQAFTVSEGGGAFRKISTQTAASLKPESLLWRGIQVQVLLLTRYSENMYDWKIAITMSLGEVDSLVGRIVSST